MVLKWFKRWQRVCHCTHCSPQKWISILTLRESNLPCTAACSLEEFPQTSSWLCASRPHGSPAGLMAMFILLCLHIVTRGSQHQSSAPARTAERPGCARATAPQLSILHEPAALSHSETEDATQQRREREGKPEGGRQKSSPSRPDLGECLGRQVATAMFISCSNKLKKTAFLVIMSNCFSRGIKKIDLFLVFFPLSLNLIYLNTLCFPKFRISWLLISYFSTFFNLQIGGEGLWTVLNND